MICTGVVGVSCNGCRGRKRPPFPYNWGVGFENQDTKQYCGRLLQRGFTPAASAAAACVAAACASVWRCCTYLGATFAFIVVQKHECWVFPAVKEPKESTTTEAAAEQSACQGSAVYMWAASCYRRACAAAEVHCLVAPDRSPVVNRNTPPYSPEECYIV